FLLLEVDLLAWLIRGSHCCRNQCTEDCQKKWPGFLDNLRGNAYHVPSAKVFKFDGTYVCEAPLGQPGYPSVTISRAEFQQLYSYVVSLGIPVGFNHSVSSYYETGEKGVVFSDGRKIQADVVVATDGVGSISWEIVSGKKDRPISSSYAIYRVTYPVEPALKNPIIAAEYDNDNDRMSIFVGPDAHMITRRKGQNINWFMAYKDDGNADESWLKSAPADKALKHITCWTPLLEELVKETPHNSVLDWKLLWRNPQLNGSRLMGESLK
ncbi:hypothetical protein N7447_010179, partial [Penicillium robsamsonii]|uniref:uncharacterized protein n=1 Tax=Penicillium robsamsonii TaxID=1792511 RepID=UPI0025467EDB